MLNPFHGLAPRGFMLRPATPAIRTPYQFDSNDARPGREHRGGFCLRSDASLSHIGNFLCRIYVLSHRTPIMNLDPQYCVPGGDAPAMCALRWWEMGQAILQKRAIAFCINSLRIVCLYDSVMDRHTDGLTHARAGERQKNKGEDMGLPQITQIARIGSYPGRLFVPFVFIRGYCFFLRALDKSLMGRQKHKKEVCHE